MQYLNSNLSKAIITYMVDQKAKIAATKKRKAKEAEQETEEVPKKVFKGQCKYTMKKGPNTVRSNLQVWMSK